jgi:hypothetical protein
MKQRRFVMVGLLTMITFLFAWGAVEASADLSGEMTCMILQDDGTLTNTSKGTFEDCAVSVYGATNRSSTGPVYGQWGDYQLTVDENRDVYYGSMDSNGIVVEWLYWGDLSFLELTLDEVINVAAYDLNAYWAEVFETNELTYQQPGVAMYGSRQARSACGTLDANYGPLYCPFDHTIYLPEVFMQLQYDHVGDYAVVVIVSHEWGHAIQAQLNILGGDYYTIQTELQADCLAGAYSEYATTRSENVIVEKGDVEEGAHTLFLAGDDLPWFEPGAHGSGDQRADAFNNGLGNGVAVCNDYLA